MSVDSMSRDDPDMSIYIYIPIGCVLIASIIESIDSICRDGLDVPI